MDYIASHPDYTIRAALRAHRITVTDDPVAAYAAHRPRVIFISDRFPARHGTLVMRDILDLDRDAKVVMIGRPRRIVAESYIALGAAAVIGSDLDKELGDVLRLATGHEVTRPSAVLTPHQRDILQALASGLTKDEAGELLGLSGNTVKSRTARITKALGARNVAHAVALAMRSGDLL